MLQNKIARMSVNYQSVLKLNFVMKTVVRSFHVSCPLQHDPNLKKKKKVAIDPKKARKMEKQEARRRLEPIVIPVDPDSVADPALVDEKRRRPLVSLSVEELEERVLLSKEWSRYSLVSHKSELYQLQVKARSRQDALRELKKVSAKLYDEAIKVDSILFPVILNGPVDTPPCKEYIPPDLDDITSKKKLLSSQ